MSDRSTAMLIRDEESLADFVEGRLDAATAAQVQAWLAEDSDAFDAVVLARSLMDEESKLMGARLPVPAAQLTAQERAKALFSESPVAAVFRFVQGALDLIGGGASGVWAPVAAPAVRGQGGGPDGRDLWAGRIQAGEDTLLVEVERTAAGALIAAGVDNAARAQVVLLRDDSVVTLRPATVVPAELAQVEAGRFHVEVRRGGRTTGRASVVLEAA